MTETRAQLLTTLQKAVDSLMEIEATVFKIECMNNNDKAELRSHKRAHTEFRSDMNSLHADIIHESYCEPRLENAGACQRLRDRLDTIHEALQGRIRVLELKPRTEH